MPVRGKPRPYIRWSFACYHGACAKAVEPTLALPESIRFHLHWMFKQKRTALAIRTRSKIRSQRNDIQALRPVARVVATLSKSIISSAIINIVSSQCALDRILNLSIYIQQEIDGFNFCM